MHLSHWLHQMAPAEMRIPQQQSLIVEEGCYNAQVRWELSCCFTSEVYSNKVFLNKINEQEHHTSLLWAQVLYHFIVAWCQLIREHPATMPLEVPQITINVLLAHGKCKVIGLSLILSKVLTLSHRCVHTAVVTHVRFDLTIYLTHPRKMFFRVNRLP